ncbi:MAG: nicotinate phosphoribosyltransferase [Nitriliruptoraceae bacterium]
MTPARPAAAPTSLHTDRYELTMLDAALRAGTADRRCAFETFTRALPDGRRYGVFAGLGRLVEAIERFRFETEQLDWLSTNGVVSDDTIHWLADYRFSGDIVAYREGEVFFADSPVLTVTAPFGEAVLLETIVLSILNYDSAVASAAARMVTAAVDRPLLEFGSRRTHEEAAIAAARATYVAGFDATSNLAAGEQHGIPTAGTAAHAFILVHDDEAQAFDAQLRAAGHDTTLLVDTYATEGGIRTAIDVARDLHGRLGAIRIDSGDLAEEATRARVMLDDAGFTDTRIVVSGDLDEFRIADLRGAPIDGFGVGTSVVTGSGAPTAGFVYKLVAREADGRWIPVAKSGGPKATRGGRKRAVRRIADGRAVVETLDDGNGPVDDEARMLQVPVIDAGDVVTRPTLAEIRDHHAAARAELGESAHELAPGPPAITVTPMTGRLHDASDR